MKYSATKNARASGVALRVEDILRSLLPAGVSIRLLSPDADRGLLRLDLNGHSLSALWIGEGRLRSAREIAVAARRPDIVVARVMSPGARDLLSAAGVGWADETGAAEIARAGVVVSRSGRAPTAERPARWARGTLAVAEAILCETVPTVTGTATATGLSQGTCAAALRTLTEFGLLTADSVRGRNSARRVTNPDALLDAYTSAAAALAPPASVTLGVTWQDPLQGLVGIGEALDNLEVRWATTGFAAAALVAPLLTTVSSAEVYVGARTVGGLDRVGRDLGLRPIAGGRLTLRPFPTPTSDSLASRVEGVRVVPWPRLYADLVPQGVRGEEAAEHVKDIFRVQ